MTGPPEMPAHEDMPEPSLPSGLTFEDAVAEAMPSAVAACLIKIAAQDRSLAYCQVTPDGCLMSWGGALETYGLQSLAVGASVSDYLFFLEGFFPLAEPHELLPSMQTPQGLTMDVHLLLGSDIQQAEQAEQATYPRCGWILLLDATAETQRQQQLQQKGNDLSLLRAQYAKLLRRTERSQMTSSQAGSSGALAAGPDPELSLRSQQTVSVLVVDLYDLGNDLGTANVFDRATAAFSLITQFVTEEGGLVNHVLGTTMVVLFGVIPSLQSSAQQALSAANKLLRHYIRPSEKAQSLGEAPPSGKGEPLIGMAITTGPADTGLVTIHGSQMINAVGPHMQKAFVLSGRSRPDTLIIDKATLHSWQANWQDSWQDSWQANWENNGLASRPKSQAESRAETENPLKSALFSQILTTHHDYPDFRPQSLELYELTPTTSFGAFNRHNGFNGIGPMLSQPPP